MRDAAASGVDVRRSEDRFTTRTDWLQSRHCFSFGSHYDHANTGFGSLVVSNDDRVAPGAGFDTHPHREMEIVTWVLEGALVHQDSIGRNGVIPPGLAQRMSAGTGILHSEKNDSWTLTGEPRHSDPVHFVQMWVVPDEAGAEPGYEQLDISEELEQGELVTVASGIPAHAGRTAIHIGNRSAALHAARLRPGGVVQLPVAPYVHLFVARGEVELEAAGRLTEGDAARITGADGQRVSAGAGGAEVLIWEMHSPVARVG